MTRDDAEIIAETKRRKAHLKRVDAFRSAILRTAVAVGNEPSTTPDHWSRLSLASLAFAFSARSTLDRLAERFEATATAVGDGDVDQLVAALWTPIARALTEGPPEAIAAGGPTPSATPPPSEATKGPASSAGPLKEAMETARPLQPTGEGTGG